MDIKLEDKYKLIEGTRFLTGAQALVRVPIVQARRDKKKILTPHVIFLVTGDHLLVVMINK